MGGAPDIAKVSSCLKEAGMQVTGPQGKDAQRVQEGVSGTSGLQDGAISAGKPLTIVVAAVVKKDTYVNDFISEVKTFKSRLSKEDAKKFSVRSGNKGKYVWVVAGDEKSDEFRKGKDCVKS